MSIENNQNNQKPKDSILLKAVKSGTAGAGAMTIQVTSLMWMRTTMNYQFKNGGAFFETLRLLYKQGGVKRFYRGLVPALMIGPISRFGDTATNMYASQMSKSSQTLKHLPIFIQTSFGSLLAGCWRLSTLPIDAWKTSKQVHGSDGLKMLIHKYQTYGLKTFYQGGIASAIATTVGHYPWFLTNNYLQHYIPKYHFRQQTMKALIRSAGIGFMCTLVSDTVSNSIRVLKTVKQTSQVPITYKEALQEVVRKDGVMGLFFRGLKTKLLTNGIQGCIFSIAWRYFTFLMDEEKKHKQAK